jgi:hypothetical protein
MEALIDRVDLMIVIFFTTCGVVTPVIIAGIYLRQWFRKRK